MDVQHEHQDNSSSSHVQSIRFLCCFRELFLSRRRQRSWPLRKRLALYLLFTVTIIHFYTSIVRNTIALCGQGFIRLNRATPPHWDTMPALKQKKERKKASKDVRMESCKHVYSKMAVVVFFQIAEVHVKAFTLL